MVQILVESTGLKCPVVLHLFFTLSPGFDNNHIFKCWFGIFQQSWHIWFCWKIEHFSVWLLSNQGAKLVFLLKFNEARIPEWMQIVSPLPTFFFFFCCYFPHFIPFPIYYFFSLISYFFLFPTFSHFLLFQISSLFAKPNQTKTNYDSSNPWQVFRGI